MPAVYDGSESLFATGISEFHARKQARTRARQSFEAIAIAALNHRVFFCRRA
jgi:hypothetical protein